MVLGAELSCSGRPMLSVAVWAKSCRSEIAPLRDPKEHLNKDHKGYPIIPSFSQQNGQSDIPSKSLFGCCFSSCGVVLTQAADAAGLADSGPRQRLIIGGNDIRMK